MANITVTLNQENWLMILVIAGKFVSMLINVL
jgi:hypothetical protein